MRPSKYLRDLPLSHSDVIMGAVARAKQKTSAKVWQLALSTKTLITEYADQEREIEQKARKTDLCT